MRSARNAVAGLDVSVDFEAWGFESMAEDSKLAAKLHFWITGGRSSPKFRTQQCLSGTPKDTAERRAEPSNEAKSSEGLGELTVFGPMILFHTAMRASLQQDKHPI